MLLVSNILKKRQIKMTEVEENLFGIDKLNIKVDVQSLMSIIQLECKLFLRN